MYPPKLCEEEMKQKDRLREEKRYILFSNYRLQSVIRKRLLAIAEKANEKRELSKKSAKAPIVTQQGKYDETNTSVPGSATDDLNMAESDACPAQSEAKPSRTEKYEWTRLDEFAKLMLQKEQAREKEEKEAMQRKVREDLDRQMRDVHARKQRERIDDLEFAQRQMASTEKWEALEREKEERRRERAEQEKRDGDEQLRLDELRRRELHDKQKREEQLQAAQIESEIKASSQEAVRKKEAERLLLKKLMEDNERDRQHKAEIKKRSAADELKQLQEFHDLLEKQEAERQGELSRRVERQKLLVKRMEEGVLKTIQAKSNDDNIRALKQQAEMDARAIEVQRFKQTKQAQLRQEMLDTLKRQIKEKEARKREETELKEIHSHILRSDSQHYSETEAAAMRARKQKLREYQHELRLQIKEASNRSINERDQLTKTEISMNKELLQLIDSLINTNHAGRD